ncbi:MAG: MFS transporter [Planctomyces sp.]|nr:MFS transporter [Planctomyces sp.]
MSERPHSSTGSESVVTASGFRTAPDPNETGWPGGVPYIIGNEACERFSFYGMKAILQAHLTILFAAQMLATKGSELLPAEQELAEANAQHMGHLFMAAVYATPMIGAIIADRLLGKYRTIMWLSLVYCAGHAVLAVGENSVVGMAIGLGLIAIGSGGIKPCVSANVGDQFGRGNNHLVQKVFQWFYFSINFGSFFSTLIIPLLNRHYGPSVAFGLPGVLMFIATILFWMGRRKFIHVPPNPGGKLGLLDSVSSLLLFLGLMGIPMFFAEFLGTVGWVIASVVCVGTGLYVFKVRQGIKADNGFLSIMLHSAEAFSNGGNKAAAAEARQNPDAEDIQKNFFFASAAKKFGPEVAEGPLAVLRILSVFFLVSVFWALFDQHATSWVRQAQEMDLIVWSYELDASQISAMNALMVMMLIPLNNYLFYPGIEKLGYRLTSLRKMTIGMGTAAFAFVAAAVLQMLIDNAGPGKVPVLWQVVQYLIMTQAEVMVSITGLEFAYTQAPKTMKSTVMGFWLLSVSFGNILVAVLSRFESLTLQNFFWVFAGLMALASILFAVFAMFYKYRDYSKT